MQQRKLFLRLIINLYAAEAVFIALTPLALSCSRLAIFWPLLFLAVQVLLGWHTAKTNLSPLTSCLAGAAAQLPGIISALVDFVGYARNISTPEAFDFAAQVWASPFAPLFPLLPRTQYNSVPFYFLVTLVLPFVIAPLPMCGLLLRRSRADARKSSPWLSS